MLLSEISSVVTPDDTHSASSSRTAAVCPEPLLSAVLAAGGDLVVNYTDEKITLTGDAKLVYTGEALY